MQAKFRNITISASVFFITLLFGFILFKPILKSVVKQQKSLRAGNEMRGFYLKLPIPLQFRVYFFNITNPIEVVEEGKTPVLREIGPFCYDAYKEKIIVEEDEKRDTLTYTPYETYYFNKQCSGSLDQNDSVTILNPLIVGIINTITQTQPGVIKIVNKALKPLFKENNGIYLTTRVRDILFDGILIDCNTKDFSAGAVCSELKTNPIFIEGDPGKIYFSLLGKKNGTVPKRMTICRGIKQGKDIGRLLQTNNQTNLNMWGDEKCDKFRGTDGWVFPPIRKNSPVWSVSGELCRSIKTVFVKNTKFMGVSVKKYHANLGDMSSNQDEKCFCADSDNCLPKGIMNLTKCMNAPIYATLPHFLDVDERIANGVKGLEPDAEKHIIEILFEPMTGTPMAAYKRLQFNLQIQPVDKVSIMKTVPECLHPFMWVEESIELKGFLLKKITNVFLLLKIVTAFKYIILFTSLGFLGFEGYKLLKDGTIVQTVHPLVNTFKETETVEGTNEKLESNGNNFQKY